MRKRMDAVNMHSEHRGVEAQMERVQMRTLH